MNNDSPSAFGGQFKNEHGSAPRMGEHDLSSRGARDDELEKHGQRLHLSASQLNAYTSAFENDFVKEAQEHVG